MCRQHYFRLKTPWCRRNSRGYRRSSVFIRRWGAAGSLGWKGRSMLFKPELNETAKAAGRSVMRSVLRRMVSLLITLLILGGLGYIGWLAWQQKPGGRNANARPDLPVPVLAATPRVQDMPVYLEGVGSVRALNTETVRAQVDGKLLAV